ncbi:Thiol:disulfide interchange protein DsbC precursor [Kluyvera cryocrescens]|uniref:Thiol:disulfide interchange protein DsbC n=1 Tax=Kluyvera cryocrescens TaxID=580 RepID=A0A485B2S6_KLUCR|nr:Thiol:disulfide interchange protein DsbC precursor [Kluyvera cryocrescens]
MKAIWCAKDRNKAFDDAMNGKGVQAATCDLDIANHYALGVQFGVNGTPAIVLNDGLCGSRLPGAERDESFPRRTSKNRPAVNNSRETTDSTAPP